MIEIKLENIKARTEALNLQLFNFKSKMRFNLIIHDVNNPNRYSLEQYNIVEVPLQGLSVIFGDISVIFNYQQAVFNTLSMLRTN